MMLDLGGALVRARDILGVFDLANTTVMRDSRDYLSAAEKGGDAVTVSYELPRTFVVAVENGKRRVYISPVLSGTLLKRIKTGFGE